MKKPIFLFALCLGLSTFANAATQKAVLNVPTMDCETCPLTIKAALLKVPGVSSARVSYKKREAIVEYDDTRTSLAELKKATADVGYPSLLQD
ncbi:MAG: mercury resistance system periplasmic binding protein MerP [Rhodocyclaceae bacterium]|nr:mercury resistance system periplasmic binding protein MerP [Rhodocyclaceae bacterium]